MSENNLDDQAKETFAEIDKTSTEVLNNAMDEQPVDEQPVDEQPVDEQPVDEQPADEQPVDEQPADEQPVDEDVQSSTKNEQQSSGDAQQAQPTESKQSTTVESSASENKSETNEESSEDVQQSKIALLKEIGKLLKQASNYSYLNCGRHLRNTITRESLRKFYIEFVKQNERATANDVVLIDLLKKYFDLEDSEK